MDRRWGRTSAKLMASFYFERETRTPNSECYTVLANENAVGRVDIHFATPVVHATLNVMDGLGVSREEIIVHVHQGRDLGVFSTRNFEGENDAGHHHMS